MVGLTLISPNIRDFNLSDSTVSRQQLVYILINLGFILIGTFLFYILLNNWQKILPFKVKNTLTTTKSNSLYFILAFLSLSLIVPVINFGILSLYKPKMERYTYDNLQVIAKIKAIQLERWLEFRQGDAKIIATDQNFAKLVLNFQAHQNDQIKQLITKRFDSLIKIYDFEGASLFDAKGNELIQVGSYHIDPEIKTKLIVKANHSGKVENSDFYQSNDETRLDIIAPIHITQGNQQNIAFVIINSGPGSHVLPRLLAWPTSSISAEALLVKRAENNEELITFDRASQHISSYQKHPIRQDSPYQFSGGLLKGIDYRGNRIFASSQVVTNSAWELTTQIDQAEALKPIQTFLLWISVIALVAVGLVTLTLLMLLRQQQKSHELEIHYKNSERDRLLKRFYGLPFLGMAIIDPLSKHWVQVNNQFCEFLGYSKNELLSMTWLEVSHPDELAIETAYYDDLVRGDINFVQYEKRYLHKSGKIVIGRIELNCHRDESGKLEMLLVTVEDITERKQSEFALKASEERLSLVFKGTNDGWWDLDLVNNIAYHSPRWWEMLGYEENQNAVDPQLWKNLTHPDDVAPTLNYIRGILASDLNSYEVELRLQHKSGHYVPILTRALITRNAEESPTRISGANMDLTQLKKAEESLRQQEEFKRIMLENQSDGVIACDVDMNLVLFNQTAREWHGCDAAHIPASDWNQYYSLHDSNGNKLLNENEIPLVRAFNGERVVEAEMSIKAKDQETRFVSVNATPFYDGAGKKIGAVAIMRDISVSRRFTQALKTSETLYKKMFDVNPHPMWVFDINTLYFLAVNDAAISHYGWSRTEFLGMKISDISLKTQVKKLELHVEEMVKHDIQQSGEWQHLKKDGTLIDVEINSHTMNFSERAARLVLAYDITERKQNEQQVHVLNRLLTMLTNINQTIVRRLSPSIMFNEACTIAVRDGKFRMAWIGLISENQQYIRCVAYAGHTGTFLEDLQIDKLELNLNIPAAEAIRKNNRVICNDIVHDSYAASWSEHAFKNDYKSMIALPLRCNGRVVGNFSLFSAEVNTFNIKEIEMLDELAGDISFALEVSEVEKSREKALQALKESEALFHTLASSSPVGIFRTDKHGDCIYINESYQKITGINQQYVGKGDVWMTLHEKDKANVETALTHAHKEQTTFNMEFRFQQTKTEAANDSVIWVKGLAEPEFNTKGHFLGLIGTLTDISELKASQESMRLSAAVSDNSREVVLVTDADVNIVMVNTAFTLIEGYTKEEVIGRNPSLLKSGRHDKEYFFNMFESLNKTGYFQGEIWNRRKNGEVHPGILSISKLIDETGEVTNYVSTFTDISNIKATEEQLEFLANHDALTSLPNRMMLLARLSHAIEFAKRNHRQIALLMLDLDGFKNINDSYGHLAGDEILQQLAARLTSRLRSIDTVARLGGDEFIVMLEDIAQSEYAARVAQDLIDTIDVPWKLSNGAEVHVSTSIGISIYPAHGSESLDLLRHADAALYQAKAAGRRCARYFSESLTQTARNRFRIEAKLRTAINNNLLYLCYQPKLDVKSGAVIGVEALVRWQDEDEGLIMPNDFISIAEETGLINKLGEWVFKEACLQGKRWLDAGLKPLSIAVNLSGNQLHHSDIVTILTNIIEKTGFPAHHLELELTESVLMHRETEIVDKLNAIRDLGISLAIDDFGTGYSSLAYLKRFPLDVLKVDRSFVADIEHDADDRAITSTIIGIAKTLELLVVAEGVETEAQLAFLKAQGCNMYQGYLASPALPADEFAIYYKRSLAIQELSKE